MPKLAYSLMGKLPYNVFTDIELFNLIKTTPNSLHSLVKRALKSGDILRFKRGVYALGKLYQREPLNNFEIANKIYYPSYISLESALSFHNLIPEATYTVTSVCSKRTKEFKTSLGIFSYKRVPKFNFIGVNREIQNSAIFLCATPIKALMDYVYIHKIDVKSISDLLNSLRIELNDLKEINYSQFENITGSFKSLRVLNFAKKLRKELGF